MAIEFFKKMNHVKVGIMSDQSDYCMGNVEYFLANYKEVNVISKHQSWPQGTEYN
jgi:hypothetical protein